MPASIGVNLRVTGHCSQGGRKYMEDLFSVAYQQTEDERDLEYAFFGIYDGHGGSEAAAFAKEHLMDSIVKQRQFWSDNDEDVLKAIRNGYMLTHLNMWKELEKWPKTVTGLPSTAGTTASIAFIRRGKIYIGHVGDSAIVLGYQKEGCEEWAAKPLTSDHKPESSYEMERIERCGGKVVSKAGVPRVVWNRPRPGHKGPIKKNTPMDEIPFLAVARSLGDLWSYNSQNDEFIVSPDPDVGVLLIDPSKFRCLIFGTDGLWNMISPEGAVNLVQSTERHNEAALVAGGGAQRDWLNPSKSLVDHALERWSNTRMRADNTSVVTLMLDPPGPPRATVLRSRTAQRPAQPTSPAPPAPPHQAPPDRPRPEVPQNGLTIMTRYSDVDRASTPPAPQPVPPPPPLPPCATIDGRFSLGGHDDGPLHLDDAATDDVFTNYGNPAESSFMARLLHRTRLINTLSDVYDEIVNAPLVASPDRARNASPPLTCLDIRPEPPPTTADVESTCDDPSPTTVTEDDNGDAPPLEIVAPAEDGVQINEVSSSSPTECPPRPRGRRLKADLAQEMPTPTNGRVLRSHDADASHRPQTRRTAGAGRNKAADPPPPALERVVILNRARGVPVPPAVLRINTQPEVRSTPRRGPAEPVSTLVPTEGRGKSNVGRVTRSKDSAPLPLAQKITRSISNVARELRGQTQPVASVPSLRPGNASRAPGPVLRSGPGLRTEPADPLEARTECSKENFGSARRRRGGARARDPPAPVPVHLAPRQEPLKHPPRPFTRLLHSVVDVPPRPPRYARRAPASLEENAAEVHSTTGDAAPLPMLCIVESKTLPVVRPRALRSRNDAGPQLVAPGVGPRREPAKRPPNARDDRPPATKAAKLSVVGERCTRALGKRASGPWAPALALRNRLRKRLAK